MAYGRATDRTSYVVTLRGQPEDEERSRAEKTQKWSQSPYQTIKTKEFSVM